MSGQQLSDEEASSLHQADFKSRVIGLIKEPILDGSSSSLSGCVHSFLPLTSSRPFTVFGSRSPCRLSHKDKDRLSLTDSFTNFLLRNSRCNPPFLFPTSCFFPRLKDRPLWHRFLNQTVMQTDTCRLFSPLRLFSAVYVAFYPHKGDKVQHTSASQQFLHIIHQLLIIASHFTFEQTSYYHYNVFFCEILCLFFLKDYNFFSNYCDFFSWTYYNFFLYFMTIPEIVHHFSSKYWLLLEILWIVIERLRLFVLKY